jgi:hypothetical protein
MTIGVELRIEHLKDNVSQDFKLLKEYEDLQRLEEDPRRRARNQRAIEQLRESAGRYQQEYEELQRQAMGEPPADRQRAEDQLQEIKSMLAEIQSELRGMRLDLIALFDASERRIIGSVIDKLDQSQLAATKSIIEAMEADRVKEGDLKEALRAVQQALSEILEQPQRHDPKMVGQATSLSKALDDPKLDSAHKLKLSVPIIPFILSYEGVVELKGGLNLRSAWNALKAKVG